MAKDFQFHLFDIYGVEPMQNYFDNIASGWCDSTLDKKTLNPLNNKCFVIPFRINIRALDS